MKKIEWCCNTKNGIELVEPNGNLAEAYIAKAESSLETSRLAKSKDWKISAAYYAMYFSVYAILQKTGVKCEIHTCTILFANEFLAEYFSKEQLNLLDEAFDARQDAQYYVNREVSNKIYDEIISETPAFISYCKNVVLKLDEKKIKEIRNKLSEYMKNK